MNKMKRCFNKRQWRLEELPDLVMIETVVGCNLRCEMCPVPQSKSSMNGRTTTFMSMQTFQAILAAIADKPRKLHLNQLGEPLLNREIAQFVALGKQGGHWVSLTTNGTLMDEETAHRLLQAGIDRVTFSIDGFHAATYEGIRKGADYEKVRGNVERFCKLKRELGLRTEVQIDCIDSDLTRDEIPLMQKYWLDKVDRLNTIPLDDWAGKHELPVRFGLRNWVSKAGDGSRYPCDLLWTTVSVSAEGRGMYCCHDYKFLSELPSVNETPLKEIWREQLSRERRKHVTGSIDGEPCLHCDAWKTRLPYCIEPSKAGVFIDLLLQKLGSIIRCGRGPKR